MVGGIVVISRPRYGNRLYRSADTGKRTQIFHTERIIRRTKQCGVRISVQFRIDTVAQNRISDIAAIGIRTGFCHSKHKSRAVQLFCCFLQTRQNIALRAETQGIDTKSSKNLHTAACKQFRRCT